ncbi:hypothetical protein AAHC03_09122 [Spirometra sp. Aus1]
MLSRNLKCALRLASSSLFRQPYFFPDELPIQQAEVDAAVDPKVQKPKLSTEEGEVAAVEETGEVAAKATITSEQATEEVEQAQE